MVEDYLSISQVAKKYKLTLRSLRFYEQINLIAPIRHKAERLYTSKDCIKIELILKGKRMGFSLNELKSILRGEEIRDVTSALSRSELEDKIRQLEKRRDDLQEAIGTLYISMEKAG